MKKVLLSACLLIASCVCHGSDGLEENFDDNTLTGWAAPQSYYTLTEVNQELKVDANTVEGAYHGFTFTFPQPIDLSMIPYVKVRIKSALPCSVRIDLQDDEGWITNHTA